MLAPRKRNRRPDSGKARPEAMEPTIRPVLGHDVYRRPEPCPICSEPTDLFLTGLPMIDDEVWRWLRPHPACVLQDLLGRTSTRRIDHVGESGRMGTLCPLGTVRVGSAVWGRPERYREALERHRRGDFGTFGPLPVLSSDLDPWCPGAYDVATRNALALTEGRGLVWSRTQDDRKGPPLMVLTALLEGTTSTLVFQPSLLRPEDLALEGIPSLDVLNAWTRKRLGLPPMRESNRRISIQSSLTSR